MTLYGIGRVFFREVRRLNILAGVALMFAAAFGEQLSDASVQLSFTAWTLIRPFAVPSPDTLCAWLLSVSRWAVAAHARWDPDWRIPGPPWWLAALLVMAFVAAALRTRTRWTRAAAWLAVAVTLAAMVIHPFAPQVDRGRFEL